MNNRNERCAVHTQAVLIPWIQPGCQCRGLKKHCRAVCIKHITIQFLTLLVTLTAGSLSVMHSCFIHSTPFILADNHLSIPLTPTFSHTLVPSNPHTAPSSPDHNTVSDLTPICFSLVSLLMRTRRPHHFIGLCREIQGKPLPSFMFIAKHECPISTVLPACCIRQKHA